MPPNSKDSTDSTTQKLAKAEVLPCLVYAGIIFRKLNLKMVTRSSDVEDICLSDSDDSELDESTCTTNKCNIHKPRLQDYWSIESFFATPFNMKRVSLIGSFDAHLEVSQIYESR